MTRCTTTLRGLVATVAVVGGLSGALASTPGAAFAALQVRAAQNGPHTTLIIRPALAEAVYARRTRRTLLRMKPPSLIQRPHRLSGSAIQSHGGLSPLLVRHSGASLLYSSYTVSR